MTSNILNIQIYRDFCTQENNKSKEHMLSTIARNQQALLRTVYTKMLQFSSLYAHLSA
jgi:hypothetical protein